MCSGRQSVDSPCDIIYDAWSVDKETRKEREKSWRINDPGRVFTESMDTWQNLASKFHPETWRVLFCWIYLIGSFLAIIFNEYSNLQFS